MNIFFQDYIERKELMQFITSFKSIAWVGYLMRESDCSTVYQLIKAQSSDDPKIQSKFQPKSELRFLYRKLCGENLRVRTRIEMYEEIVPGSESILQHPLFTMLGALHVDSWLFPVTQESEIEKLPAGFKNKLRRIKMRFSKELLSPMKSSTISQFLKGDSLDCLAALLMLYEICHQQYVRPAFFRALEKSMFRLVIRMFCFHYDPRWAYKFLKLVQLKINDIYAVRSPIKRFIENSPRKKEYVPAFFNRVNSEPCLLRLIRRTKAINQK